MSCPPPLQQLPPLQLPKIRHYVMPHYHHPTTLLAILGSTSISTVRTRTVRKSHRSYLPYPARPIPMPAQVWVCLESCRMKNIMEPFFVHFVRACYRWMPWWLMLVRMRFAGVACKLMLSDRLLSNGINNNRTESKSETATIAASTPTMRIITSNSPYLVHNVLALC